MKSKRIQGKNRLLEKKKIAILGSTGSIGTQALEDYKKLQSSIKTGTVRSSVEIEEIEKERAAFEKMIADQIALMKTADEKFFAAQKQKENQLEKRQLQNQKDLETLLKSSLRKLELKK